MTLDERVEEAWSRIEIHLCSKVYKAAIKNILRRALIEQDKITLRAAAEVVVTLPAIKIESDPSRYYSGQIGMTIREFKNAAHAAVMNCRGGVE